MLSAFLAKYVEIPDRLDALHYAIDHAQEGDLIAVIGKGHEAYRDREGVKTPPDQKGVGDSENRKTQQSELSGNIT